MAVATQQVVKKVNAALEKKLDYRKRITTFAKALATVPGVSFGDNSDCPLKHSFVDGIYIREIFLPAGYVCVGKIHRHDHPNFLMKGRVTVVTEDGGMEELQAPLSMISLAGTQRAVYVHEDTVWITIHYNPDNIKDLEKLEDFIITKSRDDIVDVMKKELT